MSKRHIAVVGAGIAGSAVAFELARLGAVVTLYDDPNAVGAASRAAGGISAIKGQLVARGPFFRDKLAGHRFLPAWIAEVSATAARPIAHRFDGLLEPIVDEDSYDHLRERVFHKNFTGCYRAKFCDSRELDDVVPKLASICPRARAGVFFPADGWVDPDALLDALRLAIERLGGFFCAERVDAIEADAAGGWQLTCGARRESVQEVVIAAGIFANALLAQLGITTAQQQACEGETLFRTLAAPHRAMVLAFAKQQLRIDGFSLVFGSTSRNRDHLAECAPSPAFLLQSLADLGLELPPGLDELRWGVRGRFRSRAPLVGPLACPFSPRPLWVSLGFHKSGFQLAPLLARRLARQILSGQ